MFLLHKFDSSIIGYKNVDSRWQSGHINLVYALTKHRLRHNSTRHRIYACLATIAIFRHHYRGSGASYYAQRGIGSIDRCHSRHLGIRMQVNSSANLC